MSKRLEYGVADKAWHPLIGCSPNMSCAPRCWARRTMARVVECQQAQHPERAEFFRQVLSLDLKRWSGLVVLDYKHLYDPLRWKNPAVIATGFHGDIGRLFPQLQNEIYCVCGKANWHRILLLTKSPERLFQGWTLLPNISIGCSIMNQSEADRQRHAMAYRASMGWHTHVWFEPAIGPVDWSGWEFLGGLIAGGESGPNSRPADPDWFRRTRDWCAERDVAFTFKQWGDWEPGELGSGGLYSSTTYYSCAHGGGVLMAGENCQRLDIGGRRYVRVGKRDSGNILDGQLWQEFPARWVGR